MHISLPRTQNLCIIAIRRATHKQISESRPWDTRMDVCLSLTIDFSFTLSGLIFYYVIWGMTRLVSIYSVSGQA